MLGAGQILLADHVLNKRNHGASGYLCSAFRYDNIDNSWDFCEGEGIPAIIGKQLERLNGSGSVVGIVGRREAVNKHGLAGAILRSAACNFAPAVQSRALVVRVFANGPVQKLNANLLNERIERHVEERNSMEGTPSGLDAFMMLKALRTKPVKAKCLDGKVDIHVMQIATDDAKRGARTRIHFHRNGMWVGRKLYRSPQNFQREDGSRLGGFVAVVLLDPRSAKEMCELVKKSEGPRHIEPTMTKKGRGCKNDWPRWCEGLKEIKAAIVQLAPSLEAKRNICDAHFIFVDNWRSGLGERGKAQRQINVDFEDEPPMMIPPKNTGEDVSESSGSRGRNSPAPMDDPSSTPSRKPERQLHDVQSLRRTEDGVAVEAKVNGVKGAPVHVRIVIDPGSDSTCERPPFPKNVPLDRGAERDEGALRSNVRDGSVQSYIAENVADDEILRLRIPVLAAGWRSFAGRVLCHSVRRGRGMMDHRPPLLSNRTLDYPGCEYQPKCAKFAGDVMRFTHRMPAPCLVTHLLEQGDAAFAVELCAPNSLSRRTKEADEPTSFENGGAICEQKIQLNAGAESALFYARGIVFMRSGLSLELEAEHGVSDLWRGKAIRLEPEAYDIIAETPFTKNVNLRTSLLHVTADERLEDGEIDVDVLEDNGGVFHMKMSGGEFEKYRSMSGSILLRCAIHLNALTAAFAKLQKEHILGEAGEDGCLDLPNLKELKKIMETEHPEQRTWCDDDFSPALAATRFNGMMLPEAGQEECDEQDE